MLLFLLDIDILLEKLYNTKQSYSNQAKGGHYGYNTDSSSRLDNSVQSYWIFAVHHTLSGNSKNSHLSYVFQHNRENSFKKNFFFL